MPFGVSTARRAATARRTTATTRRTTSRSDAEKGKMESKSKLMNHHNTRTWRAKVTWLGSQELQQQKVNIERCTHDARRVPSFELIWAWMSATRRRASSASFCAVEACRAHYSTPHQAKDNMQLTGTTAGRTTDVLESVTRTGRPASNTPFMVRADCTDAASKKSTNANRTLRNNESEMVTLIDSQS